MKMPAVIENTMLAPCGMNCKISYKHCFSKKPCGGCIDGGPGKPAHCLTCKIRQCGKARGLLYCHECAEFPCKLIKRLEISYLTRYGMSLIQNSIAVRDKGIPLFLEEQEKVWKCPQCGGIISLHDGVCSECKCTI